MHKYDKVKIAFKNEAKFKYYKPCNLPLKFIQLVKEEVERLVQLNVLESVSHVSHTEPCFI